MKAAYSVLPTLLESNAKVPEEKNLLESNSAEDVGFNLHPLTIPRKILIVSYVFLALAIFLSATNVVLSVQQVRLSKIGQIALDDLPRPDIFVGLPKMSRYSVAATPDMPPHDHHFHTLDHNNSNCKGSISPCE